ncbi:GntR family transcriptional regulator [Neomoorella mulderi]|uniref:HTH-type transcriptional repressor YvoA n=1 Tax=Moorella mulderi DSM 14980 TaxID=1122241 RepID=A0A151AUN5_9FIRM|nr:GntR family transcriptional regulator [Moorella mulderi]KYH31282.1 HTH-type transcriptional repressor YvoA [Moorella mulderi DSM 14980]
MSLDKQSVIPLYYQLKELIRQEIEGGVWQAGDCLPPERELCEKYEVSRATVRQALADLEREGLLERKQGKGTFVSSPKVEEDLLGFYNFSEQMRVKGYVPSVKTISVERITAPRRLAKLFAFADGEEVMRIIRLRLVNEEPLFVEKTYLPYSICHNLTLEEVSRTPVFYDILTSRCQIKVKGAKKYIEPTLVDEFESSLLGVKKGAPALLMERITYAETGEVVAICTWIVRGDRCRHYVDIVNN